MIVDEVRHFWQFVMWEHLLQSLYFAKVKIEKPPPRWDSQPVRSNDKEDKSHFCR